MIDLYDKSIPVSVVKEVDRLNPEQINYYLKIQRGKKIENETEYALFIIELQSDSSWIVPDEFMITWGMATHPTSNIRAIVALGYGI